MWTSSVPIHYLTHQAFYFASKVITFKHTETLLHYIWAKQETLLQSAYNTVLQGTIDGA